jgi:predicted DNA-binding transcriptional regulator AlpA
MKESIYKSFDELPCFLNTKQVADLLGISQSSCYELMSKPDFPVTHIGKRMVVQKDKLIEWLNKNTKGGKLC